MLQSIATKEVLSTLNGTSFIVSRLLAKGLTDDQIDQIISNGLEAILIEIYKLTDDLLTQYIPENTRSETVDEAWMIDIANKAVEENLTTSGEPKFNTAQGYACAMSALRLAVGELPDKPISEIGASPDEDAGSEVEYQRIAVLANAEYDKYFDQGIIARAELSAKSVIFREYRSIPQSARRQELIQTALIELSSYAKAKKNKKEILDGAIDLFVFISHQKGDEEAAKRCLEYLAEKMGYVELEALGLQGADLSVLVDKIRVLGNIEIDKRTKR